MSEYRVIKPVGTYGLGKEVFVSPEDYERLADHHWFLLKSGYVVRSQYLGRRKQATVYMHREVLQAQPSDVVDHKNGQRTDNRRENLRFCSISENAGNAKAVKSSSSFKGVSRDNQKQAWLAQISISCKHYYLGVYKNEEEAARAYDAAARFYFGEFAHPNFPAETKKLSQQEIKTCNRLSRKEKTSSRFRGVTWDKRRGKWYAYIRVGGKTKTAYFTTELEAAQFYDSFVKENGLKKPLNFP